MKKLICLLLVLTFCACFTIPAFAEGGDDGYVPSPGPQPGQCDHASTSVVGQKDATCTAEGYTGDQVCDNCSEVVAEGEVIPLLAHSYVDGVCEFCGAEEPSDGFSFWWIILIVVCAAAIGFIIFFIYRKKKQTA